MFRSKTCGELRLADNGADVTLAGWVQRIRKMGGMTFLDLRDRYGITQIVFNESDDASLCEKANHTGREWVLQVKGKVQERSSKNNQIPTGEILNNPNISSEIWPAGDQNPFGEPSLVLE